ncbi:amidase [Paraburkholderia phymatum]|uniref:Amidase n=1 Tax=Paraburkholderia phymatum (strain DSM 17167 / CIP 108236 / LMG 21445 / STM815) TaxID=391038 RepID=B2JSC8_PARP8|nr:amidase [Paraburkholderia phymatum]ACC73948.1 Amidase [Paraburkholderia phymatum STM815]
MNSSEYSKYDALGLAALLRSKDVSPRELMDCAIDIAREVNPKINALCYERFESAKAYAETAEIKGVFGAVPFLLKDSALASREFPTSIGSNLFRDIPFKYDSTLVERFNEAGLISFARTTVPELCMAPTTEAVANGGPTRNPWDLSRSAGGSSGGAAAAVAAGIVPIAHASDGGGSIRIPAACCGVFGLKPSRGRVPMGPSRGEGWGGLAVDGVLSRSVRDTAAALDAIGGDEIGAPYAAPSAPASFTDLLNRPVNKPLRIAKWTSAFNGVPIADECLEALEHAAVLLRRAGHDVVDSSLPSLDYDGLVRAHINVLVANAFLSVDGMVKGQSEEKWRSRLEPAIFDAYKLGKDLSAAEYVAAINTFHSVGRRVARSMKEFDLALTPTLTQLPARLGQFTMDSDFRSFREDVSKYTTFLTISNASGQPAANVPCYWTAAGLPVGVQLIGHFGREDQILIAAAQMEELGPWSGRRPNV